MSTEKEIRDYYLKEFNDNQPDNNEMKIIISQKCACNNCGKSLFDMDDYPDFTNDDRMLCEHCYQDEYYDTCNICGDSYEKHETVEEHVFYLNEVTAKELGMKVGIYQVLSFPYLYGNIVTGFEGFFDNSIQLLKPINICQIHKFVDYTEPNSGLICSCCSDTYSGKTRYSENYT